MKCLVRQVCESKEGVKVHLGQFPGADWLSLRYVTIAILLHNWLECNL